MKIFHLPFLILADIVATSCTTSEQSFLRLNPENPHYLSFNGQPEILIGSTVIWTDTKTGKKSTDELKDHKGNMASIMTPVFSQDIALLLRKSH